jgi:hypothetical protein
MRDKDEILVDMDDDDDDGSLEGMNVRLEESRARGLHFYSPVGTSQSRQCHVVHSCFPVARDLAGQGDTVVSVAVAVAHGYQCWNCSRDQHLHPNSNNNSAVATAQATSTSQRRHSLLLASTSPHSGQHETTNQWQIYGKLMALMDTCTNNLLAQRVDVLTRENQMAIQKVTALEQQNMQLLLQQQQQQQQQCQKHKQHSQNNEEQMVVSMPATMILPDIDVTSTYPQMLQLSLQVCLVQLQQCQMSTRS